MSRIWDVLMGQSTWCVEENDNLVALRSMPSDSVDSIVCDPQYGLGEPPDILTMLLDWISTGVHVVKGKGFMGQAWDAFVPQPVLWAECLRVLKPGAHLLAFAAPRTDHLMKLGIQLGGFEIRDTLGWAYGSGFPKSHNVANDIDKRMGHPARGHAIPTASTHLPSGKYAEEKLSSNPVEKYEARSEEGAPWAGWGTGLKPAFEPITLARKPFKGTVAANVLTHGTGALNIDGCRVEIDDTERDRLDSRSGADDGKRDGIYHDGVGSRETGDRFTSHQLGRWPANLIHDGSDEVVSVFPQAPGQIAAAAEGERRKSKNVYGTMDRGSNASLARGDGGSAARFFYCAKASKTDRDEGLDDLLASATTDGRLIPNDTAYQRGKTERKNTHPTVKPTALMRYLCRLITPPGGIVLDPFVGSGSTGKGAILEGFRFVGIDFKPEFCAIARLRIAYAETEASVTP